MSTTTVNGSASAKAQHSPSVLQRRLGFTKRYNYKLWCTLGFFIVLFSVIHMPFIDPDTFFKYKAGPGEGYWFRLPRYRWGMAAHLAGVLPSGLLLPLQFAPAFRRGNWISFHRYLGYTIITLVAFIGIPGGLVIANRSFGGTVDTMSEIFTQATMVYTALGLAVYNIKKLQIDQHRKWMIRGMSWMSEIIVARIWIFILATILPGNSYRTIWTCDEARFTETNSTLFDMMFPQCQGASPDTLITAMANVISTSEVEVASAVRTTFGAGLWMGLICHILATELYLSLTKDESERLRRVSYDLQLKAGLKNPGSAGITSDRYGDSSWSQPTKKTT